MVKWRPVLYNFKPLCEVTGINFTAMKKDKDQVQLFKLVFTHNWEDPESDHAALKIKSNEYSIGYYIRRL